MKRLGGFDEKVLCNLHTGCELPPEPELLGLLPSPYQRRAIPQSMGTVHQSQDYLPSSSAMPSFLLLLEKKALLQC